MNGSVALGGTMAARPCILADLRRLLSVLNAQSIEYVVYVSLHLFVGIYLFTCP